MKTELMEYFLNDEDGVKITALDTVIGEVSAHMAANNNVDEAIATFPEASFADQINNVVDIVFGHRKFQRV